MNKKLIKNNKAEFDHWLEDGKLLCYTELDGSYYSVDEKYWDYPADIGFIIDDEYVEFRKALVEGKTIQCCAYEPEYRIAGIQKGEYYDVSDENFNNPVEYYRIKSDEPKFKVGDWVYQKGNTQAIQLSNEDIEAINEVGNWDDFKLWKPQYDEWCWFWDSGMPILSQLGGFLDNGQFYTTADKYFSNCEPFIGTLPTKYNAK